MLQDIANMRLPKRVNLSYQGSHLEVSILTEMDVGPGGTIWRFRGFWASGGARYIEGLF